MCRDALALSRAPPAAYPWHVRRSPKDQPCASAGVFAAHAASAISTRRAAALPAAMCSFCSQLVRNTTVFRHGRS
eukprot:13128120-Alexandrium_andersonii.AAC.1